MHKIKLCVSTQPIEDPRGLFEIEAIPSDVGNRKADIESFNRPPDKIQTAELRGFLTVFKQGLHPKANPKKRPIGLEIDF